MNDYLKILFSYVIAFILGLGLITYIFNFPGWITGNQAMVDEYYKINWKKNIPIDFLLVSIYIVIGLIFIKLLKVESNCYKLFIIYTITYVISGSFYLYFKNNPISDNFFSKWFNSVGWSGVFYDVILILFIYIIYQRVYLLINNNFKNT
jgi:hypothetical protein